MGRPRIHRELEESGGSVGTPELQSGGYDRMVGTLANLGHSLSDQTVGNLLRQQGIPPAPKRSQTWKEFIRRHMDVLCGADFFTFKVLTWRGLVT
jgi:hypothetical protein